MKQEDKELLLRDLCARLPYGVKGNYLNEDGSLSNDELLRSITICPLSITKPNGMVMTGDIKPYLFPMSSMTHQQKAELSMLVVGVEDIFKAFLIEVEFYHKHHIDYRGLIPMGLAIDATGLNIY